MNVSPIIGPPYACSKVVPDIGPVFGESEIVIHGLQFKESDKIEVSFSSGKNEKIAQGKFVDEHTLTCQTPNFEDFGALEVNLRVNINDEGWTVNKLKFRYFANTSARTASRGPGVNSDVTGVYGVEIPFFICAKDTCNSKRTSGDDEFIVEVTNADDPKAPQGSVRLVDFDNGTHEVFYTVPTPGRYRIDVGYDDLGEPQEIIPIRGSPFYMNFGDPWTYQRTSGPAPLKRKHGALTSVGPQQVCLYGGDENGVSVLRTKQMSGPGARLLSMANPSHEGPVKIRPVAVRWSFRRYHSVPRVKSLETWPPSRLTRTACRGHGKSSTGSKATCLCAHAMRRISDLRLKARRNRPKFANQRRLRRQRFSCQWNRLPLLRNPSSPM